MATPIRDHKLRITRIQQQGVEVGNRGLRVDSSSIPVVRLGSTAVRH